ncbi:hypothetical protein HK098_004301 [Nowakowskiella sp. JEL0407]|nr:hypothetical protein HK098_004301 [Nowakowskiella sp. JEL0407]
MKKRKATVEIKEKVKARHLDNHHHDGFACVVDSAGNCPLVAIEDLFTFVKQSGLKENDNHSDIVIKVEQKNEDSSGSADVGWNGGAGRPKNVLEGDDKIERASCIGVEIVQKLLKRKRILAQPVKDIDNSEKLPSTNLEQNKSPALPNLAAKPEIKLSPPSLSPSSPTENTINTTPQPDCPIAQKCKRRKVCQACTQCRKSHVSCDSQRPCTRCVKKGVGHLCEDAPKKSDLPKPVPVSSRCATCPIKIMPNFSISQRPCDILSSTPVVHNLKKNVAKPNKLIVVQGATGPVVVPASSPAAFDAAAKGQLDPESYKLVVDAGFVPTFLATAKGLPTVSFNQNADKPGTMDAKSLTNLLMQVGVEPFMEALSSVMNKNSSVTDKLNQQPQLSSSPFQNNNLQYANSPSLSVDSPSFLLNQFHSSTMFPSSDSRKNSFETITASPRIAFPSISSQQPQLVSALQNLVGMNQQQHHRSPQNFATDDIPFSGIDFTDKSIASSTALLSGLHLTSDALQHTSVSDLLLQQSPTTSNNAAMSAQAPLNPTATYDVSSCPLTAFLNSVNYQSNLSTQSTSEFDLLNLFGGTGNIDFSCPLLGIPEIQDMINANTVNDSFPLLTSNLFESSETVASGSQHRPGFVNSNDTPNFASFDLLVPDSSSSSSISTSFPPSASASVFSIEDSVMEDFVDFNPPVVEESRSDVVKLAEGLLGCASKDSRCDTCPYNLIEKYFAKND